MTELDRGTCPVCRGRWAVRKNRTMREHRRATRPPHGFPRADDPTCEGSGQLALQLWAGTTGISL